MVVTAKTTDGKDIFSKEFNYHTQATTCRDEKMAYGAQNKASYVRDTSLQPYQTKSETIEIPLVDAFKDVRTAVITVELKYEIEKPDNNFTIHKVEKTVTLDR